MAVEFLTRDRFDNNARANSGGHWDSPDRRWPYHQAAIERVKALHPSAPSDVLEMGTMGASIITNSHTIDYADRWLFKGLAPTYPHDARVVPWPIDNGRYEIFVALRVWQHLVPMQRQAFLEARRIAKSLVMIVPEDYPSSIGDHPAAGVSVAEFTEWNDGVGPIFAQNLGWPGLLTVWKGGIG
jgi:hypothetical protein